MKLFSIQRTFLFALGLCRLANPYSGFVAHVREGTLNAAKTNGISRLTLHAQGPMGLVVTQVDARCLAKTIS